MSSGPVPHGLGTIHAANLSAGLMFVVLGLVIILSCLRAVAFLHQHQREAAHTFIGGPASPHIDRFFDSSAYRLLSALWMVLVGAGFLTGGVLVLIRAL
jgi:hypothetical protein